MAIAGPAREVSEEAIEAIIEDNDLWIVALGLNVRSGEVSEVFGNLGEWILAIVEHVGSLLELGEITRGNVEESEFFLGGDLGNEGVDVGVLVVQSIGNGGHGDKHGLGMIFSEEGQQLTEVLGEVFGEALTTSDIVDAVTDENVVGLRLGGNSLGVAAGINESADELATDTLVVNIGGRQ